jgi:hypothetical protein
VQHARRRRRTTVPLPRGYDGGHRRTERAVALGVPAVPAGGGTRSSYVELEHWIGVDQAEGCPRSPVQPGVAGARRRW